MSSLSDKTVLVTGASGGIGLETAKMLSLAGAKVVGCARRLDVLEAEMKSLPGPAIAVHVDVSDRLSVESLMDRIPDEWRSIDVLVNNAGSDVGGRQSFDQGRIDEWVGTIDINVSGLMRVTAACIPGMIERGDGHIVNLGSTQGLNGAPGCAAYAASKHAVHGFSETLRQEYAGKGIRVSEILPGMVRTDFAATRFSDSDRGDAFYDAYGQCLEAKDIARCIIFALEQPPHAVIAQMVVAPDHD